MLGTGRFLSMIHWVTERPLAPRLQSIDVTNANGRIRTVFWSSDWLRIRDGIGCTDCDRCGVIGDDPLL